MSRSVNTTNRLKHLYTVHSPMEKQKSNGFTPVNYVVNNHMTSFYKYSSLQTPSSYIRMEHITTGLFSSFESSWETWKRNFNNNWSNPKLPKVMLFVMYSLEKRNIFQLICFANVHILNNRPFSAIFQPECSTRENFVPTSKHFRFLNFPYECG